MAVLEFNEEVLHADSFRSTQGRFNSMKPDCRGEAHALAQRLKLRSPRREERSMHLTPPLESKVVSLKRVNRVTTPGARGITQRGGA